MGNHKRACFSSRTRWISVGLVWLTIHYSVYSVTEDACQCHRVTSGVTVCLHSHWHVLQWGDTPIDAVVRAATGVKKSTVIFAA